MRITLLSLTLGSLLFASCCKEFEDHNKKGPNTNSACNCPSLVKMVDSNSVVGCWVLTDTDRYSVPAVLVDSAWIPIPGDSVIIRFNEDSSFCYGNNFPWSSAKYNRFTKEGNWLWLVSPNGPSVMSAGITLVGNNELILTQHGVDTGVRERYKRQ